jgi:hypothetical protein
MDYYVRPRRTMKKNITKSILATLSFSLLSFAATTSKNLIRNGDFEKGSTLWSGDKNVVYETAGKTNRICRIEVDKKEDITFYQKIVTKNIEDLKITFRVKKSRDYKGEGLSIKFDRGDGTASGISRDLPDNTDWNKVEWTAGQVARGKSRVKMIFVVESGKAGSLSFDDIEVVEKIQAYQN